MYFNIGEELQGAYLPFVGVREKDALHKQSDTPLHHFETRQHRVPDSQSALCGAQPGHYALQLALECPTEPFISQPVSPPFTDLLLHAMRLHGLHSGTGKLDRHQTHSVRTCWSSSCYRPALTAASELSTPAPWTSEGACRPGQMVSAPRFPSGLSSSQTQLWELVSQVMWCSSVSF